MQQTVEAPKLPTTLFTSRATEFGRGTKVKQLSDAPIWSPSPGAYDVKSDFVNNLQGIDLDNDPKDLKSRLAMAHQKGFS